MQDLRLLLVEAGPYFDPADPEQQTQFKPTWASPRRGSSVTREHLEIFICHMGIGKLMVSLTPLKKILTLCGGDQECWVVGQITGVELPQD